MNTFKKTAVVGLGGTGMHAVLYMKRKLLETYGEIPPMIKFLVIDTTDVDGLEGNDPVELEPGEFLKLQVREPGTLINTNPEVKAWIPDSVPRFSLTQGAKQIRPLGRLAVFANAGEIERKIKALIGSVRDFRITRHDKYEVKGENLLVNLVCSLSGGTGSGCYLDTAMLVRSTLQDSDRLIGYFLMPDIFVGRPTTANVEPNAYAALKEINYFFDNGRARYMLGGSTRTIDGGLFSAAYLINKTNAQGVEYHSLSDLKEFLGMGMLLQSTATGKGAADILDNLEGLLIQYKWFDKPTVFSSFGMSELVYPGAWYADLYARKIALRTLEAVFLGGNVDDVEDSVDDFVRVAGLREHDADDVINSVLDPGDLPSFPLPKEFKKETLPLVFGRRESHLAEARRTCRDTAIQSLTRLKAEKTAAVQARLREILSRPKGLELARAFIASLNGRLSEYKDEIAQERETYERQREEISGRYEALEAEAAREANSFFQAAKRAEVPVRKYKQTVEREGALIAEIERRDRAIDLFAHLLAETARWKDGLANLSSYCTTLIGEFSKEVEHRQSAKREIRPFTYELKPDDLTSYQPKPNPEDFLTWLTKAQSMTVMDLTEKRIADVKDLLLTYGGQDAVVEQMRSRTVDDVLRQLPRQERLEHVRQLDMMASPLWQYDRGLISGDKKTENIYLFGVRDVDDTVFEPEAIKSAIASPHPPQIVSTGDGQRVICFKIEAAVPAFVVANIKRYRERYLEQMKTLPYHLHRDWATELPDLFPSSNDDETRKYWSLALAAPFNLITRKGEYYYVRSEKKGQRTRDYLVRLGQGRREAMRVFLDDAELIEEVREQIDSTMVKLGYAQVTDALRKYCEDLNTKAARQTEEVRLQVETELKDIEEFATSMMEL